MSNADYVIREAKQSEKEDAYNLIKTYHKPEDPVSISFLRKHKNVIKPEDEKIMTENAHELILSNKILIAVHRKTSESVAAIVIVPYELSPTKNLREYPISILPHNSKYIQSFSQAVNNVYVKGKFYERYSHYKRFLLLRSMCVHEDHRGKGLAKALLKKSIEYAREHNLGVVHSCFTLPASRGSAIGASFENLMDFDLTEIKNFDGEFVFADVSPWNICALMAYDVGKEDK